MPARFLFCIVLLACTSPLIARAATGCPSAPAGHPQADWSHQYLWQTLTAKEFTVDDISVHVAPIYNLEDPAEDTWYARLIDALHIPTRDRVIHNQLLFNSGEKLNASRIYQTLRRLRSFPFLAHADITPIDCRHGAVDVAVNVQDSWTLKPDVSFTRVGGENTVQLGVKEADFLGYGKTVALGYRSGAQRDRQYIRYYDPAVAGSRWRLSAGLAHLSDGHSRSLSIDRPFFANATPWAGGASFFSRKANVNFYNRGERAWQATSNARQLSFSWRHLLAFNGDSGWRAGVRYIDESYRYYRLRPKHPALRPRPSLTDRHYRGLQATVDFFQDQYATFHNLARIDVAEDYNLGWNAAAALGYFPTAFGSSSNAWIGGVSTSWGSRLPARSVVFASGSLGGRHARGAWRGSHAGLDLSFYNQAVANHTLVAHLSADWRLRADPENQLYLGGFSSLRGYPNYFRAGDRRWQLTIEDRVFTPWVVLDTFHVGYVVYIDTGQVDRLGGRGWSRVFSNIGGGLRFGNSRFSFANVIYVTASIPLVRPAGVPSYQITIGDVVPF